MIEHYKKLNKREQKIVSFGGLVVMLFLFFSLIWNPIIGGNSQLKKSLDNKTDALQVVENASKILLSNNEHKQATTQSGDKRTITSRISIVTKRQGIKDMTFSTKSSNKASFDFKRVSFTKLHKSLFVLASEWGIQVESANIRRIEGESDSVDAKISFVITK